MPRLPMGSATAPVGRLLARGVAGTSPGGLDFAREGRRVRHLIAGVAVMVLAAGCYRPGELPPLPPEEPSFALRSLPTPYTEVTVGPVRALIPDGWLAAAVSGDGSLQAGLRASPRLDAWERMDGRVQGLEAVWVDVARVGIPSDYYYVVARGAALGRLTASPSCRVSQREVLVDNRPSFADGWARSPGDYMALGSGTCQHGRHTMRWAYFVAAPGFGPAREVGIPGSGLYVLVAVLKNGPKAERILNKLIHGTRFGEAGVVDLVAAALRWADQVPPRGVR